MLNCMALYSIESIIYFFDTFWVAQGWQNGRCADIQGEGDAQCGYSDTAASALQVMLYTSGSTAADAPHTASDIMYFYGSDKILVR